METYNSFEEVIQITNIHQKYQRMNKNNMCYFVIGVLQPVHIAKETTVGVCLYITVTSEYLQRCPEVQRKSGRNVFYEGLCV